MNSDEIKQKTYENTVSALKDLLGKIPFCNKIVIQPIIE